MSKIESITTELEYIYKNFSSVINAFSKNDPNMGGDLPYDRRDIFSTFTYNFKRFGVFLKDSDLNNIELIIKKLKENLDQIIESKDNDSNKTKATDFFEQINKLPNLFNLTFSPNKEATKDHLLDLIFETAGNFENIDVNHELPERLKTLSIDQFEECKKLIVEYINMSKQAIPVSMERAIHINDYLKNLLKSDIEKAVDEVNQEFISIKTLKGLKSTDKLTKIFEVEAKSLDSKISNFTSVILAIFIVLLLFIVFLLIITFNGTTFSFPSNSHFYHFYLSLFLVTTGLLTYLIKE